MTIEFDEPFWECPNCYAENGDSRGECWNCGDER
jgi:hypothetical protein